MRRRERRVAHDCPSLNPATTSEFQSGSNLLRLQKVSHRAGSSGGAGNWQEKMRLPSARLPIATAVHPSIRCLRQHRF